MALRGSYFVGPLVHPFVRIVFGSTAPSNGRPSPKRLEKGNRIPVYHHPYILPLRPMAVEIRFQDRTQSPGGFGLKQEVPAIPPVKTLDGRRGRPNQLDAARGGFAPGPEPRCAPFGFPGRLVVGRAANDDVRQTDMRRVTRAGPVCEFSLGEPLVIVGKGGPDGEVVRKRGLNEDLPPKAPSARPPGNLAQELKGPFAGPEVGKMDPDIGVDDPY